jgi:hypothetical protein
MGYAHQEQSVAQFAAGVDFVSGAKQQFAQVGEHVGIGVEAQNAAAGADGRLDAGAMVVKGGDRLLLRFVRVEQSRQVRDFQNFTHVFRHVAELHVAARLTGAGQTADNRSEAAAVNESYVAQVQDDGSAVAQQPGNVRTQRLARTTGNDPAVAAHDGDASDLASIERKVQWASDAAEIKPAKSLHLTSNPHNVKRHSVSRSAPGVGRPGTALTAFTSGLEGTHDRLQEVRPPPALTGCCYFTGASNTAP